MPRPARLGFAIAAALAVSSCSDGQAGEGASALFGSPEFVRLVEDARFEANQGNLAAAGRILDSAREIDPENASLWVEIARLRFRGGEHLPALEAADYALELGPEYAPALLMRAQLVRDAHGLADSLPWFEAAVQADPENPELLADYAATLGDLGRYKDMLSVVRELAEIDPNYPQVFYLQAVLAARAGEAVMARSLLERSGLIERGVPAAILLNSLIDMQQSTPDNAVESLQSLAGRQPGNNRVAELLARALWQSGRDDELISQLDARAQADDASPYMLELVGRAYERNGDRAGAAPLLDRARAIRVAQWAVLGGTATGRAALPGPSVEMRQYIATHDFPAAERLAGNLIDRLPASSDVRSLAGDAALASANADASLERYAIAASVRRPWPLTRKIVAAYRDYGDDRAADALLVRHLVGEPNNSEAHLMLAERSAQNEDWLRVAVLLDHAIALGAGNDPKLLVLRIQAAEALGEDGDAKEFRSRLGKVHPRGFVAS